MNKKDLGIAFGVLAIIILYLLSENSKKRGEIKMLKQTLNSNNLISETIKQQLLNLLENHPHIDEDIKEELKNIALLVGIQQESKAIFALAKIIENLLKKLYKENVEFCQFLEKNNIKKRNASFANYLDFAKENKAISDADFHLISMLKIIRNEEAHELNLIKDKSKLVGCYISGIGVVISLYNLFKTSTIENEAKILNVAPSN